MCIGGVAYSHDDPNAGVPTVQAYKTTEEIKVDGVLDEPFWQECQTSSDFIDIRTQAVADQQTIIRVAYTQTHLYISCECLDDDISQLHATERREDRAFNGDDFVEVHLDPMHTHRSKYAFFSNPLGTKYDANEGPSGQFNIGWTAEWELEAKVYEDRWTFEMSIPLSVMNFTQSDDQTWGLNFTRVLRRTDVTSFWSYNSTDYFKPRHFGHLANMDLADSQFDRNLEITPYVSTQTDINGETHSMFQSGLDVSVRLTPAITSAWTLNPDFGQVEADADTIELRDTERFLPEKRLFFREGEELLKMRKQLYYSRRFTDIEAGGKISGEWDDYKFYLLDIQGNTFHDRSYYGNSSVFRAIQNIGERSTIGYYANSSEYDQGYSRVGSVDGIIF
ncbi:carbohydrate binding family 9 domain-containing protein [bacterium]|nr:carbohydrate binding family 9 domain-containing protein [bacterium]